MADKARSSAAAGRPATKEVRIPRRGAALALILALAAVAGVLAGKPGLLPGSNTQPIRVAVIGHSWWWEFVYPELGFRTANELHVPAGTEVQLELTSVDVLHTLSIPESGTTAVALPGQVTLAAIRIEAPGELGGECSEICGTAHNMMRVKVVAQTQEEFEAWARGQRQPAAAPQTERQQAGYGFLTTACARCHSLDPNEPRSDLLGPNLAHLMSRSVFAGASFTLNESNLRRWLRDTQAMKAGNDMIVDLPRDDFEGVIEYLLLLR